MNILSTTRPNKQIATSSSRTRRDQNNNISDNANNCNDVTKTTTNRLVHYSTFNNNNDNNNNHDSILSEQVTGGGGGDRSRINFDTHADPLGYLLGKLSIDEVSSGLYDLHGVADKIEETEEMIQTKMMEMTNALNRITNKSQTTSTTTTTTTKAEPNKKMNINNTKSSSLAFEKAMDQSPEYVERLKLQFLRAESYNCQEAANRMIRFFHEKFIYFGEEKLVQDIQYENDLSVYEKDALQSGLFQLLPLRDRAGRIILFKKGSLNTEFPNNHCVMRLFFYFVMAIHNDEENQKCGTVFITYSNGQTHLVPGRIPLYWRLWSALPVRQAGFHSCQDTEAVSAGGKIVAKLIERKQLGRLRIHFGTNVECIYNLMTFGIPRDAIPVREDGTMDLTDHHRIVEVLKYREKQQQEQQQQVAQKRKQQVEQQQQSCLSPNLDTIVNDDDDDKDGSPKTSSFSPPTPLDNNTNNNKNDINAMILVPSPMDILLGQGRQQQKRPGMIKLNNLLDTYWDSYEAASKFDKTVITRLIIKLLKESNCRLLMQTPEGYFTECDEDRAHAKVAHSFRSLRRIKKKQRAKANININNDNNDFSTFYPTLGMAAFDNQNNNNNNNNNDVNINKNESLAIENITIGIGVKRNVSEI